MSTAWKNAGLLPTANMLWWHAYDPSTSANGNINDLSGNARHIVQASDPPTLEYSTTNKAYVWTFDGTTSNPLQTASAANITPKHIFVLAALDFEEFDDERGLMSGKTTNDLLWGDTAAAFEDPGGDTYLLSGTAASFDAPNSSIAELIEITDATGITLDGISVGRRKADAATKWSGVFIDSVAYSSVLTGDDLLRVYQYYNYRYSQRRRGLPFYFPDSVMTGIPRRRFYAQPKDWEKITDDFEFEDGGMAFNEIALDAPQRWEYQYQIHHQGVGTVSKDPEQLPIFDEFWNQARRKNPFYFRDKYGVTHSNVRVESYERTHDAHKPWDMNVNFTLVKFPES